MSSRDFRRTLRGYDPDEVERTLQALEDGLESTREALRESDKINTELRLNAAAQVRKRRR